MRAGNPANNGAKLTTTWQKSPKLRGFMFLIVIQLTTEAPLQFTIVNERLLFWVVNWVSLMGTIRPPHRAQRPLKWRVFSLRRANLPSGFLAF